jgi:hypothetical protein
MARRLYQDLLQFPLWFEDAVSADMAAPKKAVMHHALAKQKHGYCQTD